MPELVGYLSTPTTAALEEVTIKPDEGKTTHLQSFYELLNCKYVEMLRLDDGLVLWVDEEGLLNGAVPNPHLSAVFQKLGGRNVPFVGSGLFSAINSKGESISLTSEQQATILAAQEAVSA
jgi:hypothetical protein